MAVDRIIDILNQSRARELAVSIQYMRQHYVADGIESPAIVDEIKKIAIAEMKHAETFGERINYLGGDPTTVPHEIMKSSTELRDMIQDDLNSESGAIDLYRTAIGICIEEGDPVTRRIYEEILEAEEEHLDFFMKILSRREPGKI